MRILRDESGNILVITALSITMLISFMAVAIDIGNLFLAHRNLQTLADAAAMAGALEASSCTTTANCDVLTKAATSALVEGTPSVTPTLFKDCAAASGEGVLLTVNNGPCALGSTAADPNYGDKHYVEAVVSQKTPTFFAKVFGVKTVTVTARAEAGKSTAASPCLNILGTSGQTLTLNSGASITDGAGSTCGVNVNSNGTPAAMENSGATVNVGSYTVHGTVTNNGGSYTPSPTTGSAVVPDSIADEITAGTIWTPAKGTAQSVTTVDKATTLNAGYYQYGLNFNGSGYTVTLNPGVYYFDGGINVGGVTLNGSGVTIYMANGQLNMNSASTINLTAPTSGATAGLVIWQPSTNTSDMNLDSASNSSWGGAVYVPNGQLTLNGGSSGISYGMIEAKSVMVNSSLVLSCSSMPGGVCPGGSGSGNGSATIALAE
jgi:Flp pilus assembly protein TadG